MLRERKCHVNAPSTLFPNIPWRRVTALLLMIMSGPVTVLNRPVWSQATGPRDQLHQVADLAEAKLQIWEFSCEFYVPMGPGRLEGRIASDGARYRITIYWIEPVIYRETQLFLRYADILFTTTSVHFWTYRVPQIGTVDLSAAREDRLLPQQRSPEAVLQAALAILTRVRTPREATRSPLEVGTFFGGARGLTQYTYDAPPSVEPPDSSFSDVQILNTLPYGRTYAKETRDSGTVVWREGKVLNGRPVADVVVRRVADIDGIRPSDMFDAGTLGQGALTPRGYHTYWSLDRSYCELKDSTDQRSASRELYDRIVGCLNLGDQPREVRKALSRLRFKTAVLTEDAERAHRSAQAFILALQQDDLVDPHQSLLELARVSEQVERYYPRQARDWVRPLVRQVVGHIGSHAVDDLDRLLPAIIANGWFMYGGLLLKEIRTQGLMRPEEIDTLAARLGASRMGADRGPPDPCEPSDSVKRYLAYLDAPPPTGSIDMNDVRQILDRALFRHYPDCTSATRPRLVENVIRLIRLAVGDGPFRGDSEKLVQSLDHFADRYLIGEKTTEPIDTVLATFLALSFCDCSTAQDHELLLSQFQGQCAAIRSQMDTMLRDRGLDLLVGPERVQGVLDRCERIFLRYVDDPLWPAFKFPWTTNEQAKLTGRMKLRVLQLTPFLDDVAAKVKYGGSSPELKKRTLLEISHAVEPLLAEAAFFRKPPYPGVACRYQAKYGFTSMIQGPLYQQGHRPRERFSAMKYFHLGHRLAEVVKRERELAIHDKKEGAEP